MMVKEDAQRAKRNRIKQRHISVLANPPMPKRRRVALPSRVAKSHDSLELLPNISLKSYWGKKWVSVIAALTSDRAGVVSEAQRLLIQHAATLEVSMDLMTQKLALAGEEWNSKLFAEFQSACNCQRRMLETVGTQRSTKEIVEILEPPASEPISPVMAEVRRKAFAEQDTTSLMALYRSEERRAEESTSEPPIFVVRRE
jgi:hypothetical protein